MVRVAHLTSVHQYTDTRIFVKECRSLAAAGFEVHLVSPGAPDKVVDGVHLHGIEAPGRGRLSRMTRTVRLIDKKALALNAQIYHLHDPELIPLGIALKARGRKVIFDMHEDIPRQILDKQWIPAPFRKMISTSFDGFQRLAFKFLDAVVLAESLYAGSLPKSDKYRVIRNYPLLSELDASGLDWVCKKRAVCYVGGLTEIRGLIGMVDAVEKTDAELLLGGKFESDSLKSRVESMPGWQSTTYMGLLDRVGVANVLSQAMAGLVVLHPVPNYMVSEPTKMFEYMSAGIPVIASDFPVWRRIVEDNGCGICVDPTKPEAIASAIEWVMDHPDEARRMGQDGRRAIENKYNWELEEKKLLSLYEKLSGMP